MQRPRFGELSGATFQDVGNIVGADSVEFHGIGNGTRHRLFTVDFGQGDDLPDVVAAVEMAFIQFPIVIQ